MSSNLENRVQLVGFLGQDVELRQLAQGATLARLTVATNEFRRNPAGVPERITQWHNIIAWGQTAQTMSELLRKGQKVFVEGKLVYRQYETKAGEKRNQTEIVVNNFRKLEKDQKVEEALTAA